MNGDWQDVRKRMLELEAEHGDDHAPVGVVIARLLDVEHSEEFDQGLQREVDRAHELGSNWYAQLGLRPTVGNILTVGIMQGVTMARAIEDLRQA